MTWYGMVSYIMELRDIVWCGMVWYGAAWYGMCVHAMVERMTGMPWSEPCPAAELRAPPAAESTKKTWQVGAAGSACEVGSPKEVAP